MVLVFAKQKYFKFSEILFVIYYIYLLKVAHKHLHKIGETKEV